MSYAYPNAIFAASLVVPCAATHSIDMTSRVIMLVREPANVRGSSAHPGI